jgi:hypothetical protein
MYVRQEPVANKPKGASRPFEQCPKGISDSIFRNALRVYCTRPCKQCLKGLSHQFEELKMVWIDVIELGEVPLVVYNLN